MGGSVRGSGPASDVLLAHAVLVVHGFTVTPLKGPYEPKAEIALWPIDEESTNTAWLAFRLVKQILEEVQVARSIYFEGVTE